MIIETKKSGKALFIMVNGREEVLFLDDKEKVQQTIKTLEDTIKTIKENGKIL